MRSDSLQSQDVSSPGFHYYNVPHFDEHREKLKSTTLGSPSWRAENLPIDIDWRDFDWLLRTGCCYGRVWRGEFDRPAVEAALRETPLVARVGEFEGYALYSDGSPQDDDPSTQSVAVGSGTIVWVRGPDQEAATVLKNLLGTALGSSDAFALRTQYLQDAMRALGDTGTYIRGQRTSPDRVRVSGSGGIGAVASTIRVTGSESDVTTVWVFEDAEQLAFESVKRKIENGSISWMSGSGSAASLTYDQVGRVFIYRATVETSNL